MVFPLSILCRRGLQLGAGTPAVVTNGRVLVLSDEPVGLDAPPTAFVADDFELLGTYARLYQFASQELLTVLEGADQDLLAIDSPAAVSSVLATHTISEVG